MEEVAEVGQFWTPISAKGGSLLHADSHYDELMANKGELLKAMLKRAAEKCAKDLWHSFQEEGISASK